MTSPCPSILPPRRAIQRMTGSRRMHSPHVDTDAAWRIGIAWSLEREG